MRDLSWVPTLSVHGILVTVVNLLADPVIDEYPANAEALWKLLFEPLEFQCRAIECTDKSKKDWDLEDEMRVYPWPSMRARTYDDDSCDESDDQARFVYDSDIDNEAEEEENV
jgi:hypothetical protein